MIRFAITVSNKLGMHARASAQLTQVAKDLSARVSLYKGEQKADAKSILEILMLVGAQGDTLEIEVEGEDEAEGSRQIQALFAANFGEEG